MAKTLTFTDSQFQLAITVLGSVRRQLKDNDVVRIHDFVELTDKVWFEEFVNSFARDPHPLYAPRRNGQFNGRIIASVGWTDDDGESLFVARSPF